MGDINVLKTFLGGFQPYSFSDEELNKMGRSIRDFDHKRLAKIDIRSLDEDILKRYAEGARKLNDVVYKDDSWCVYMIYFATTRKIYIGSTNNWAKRVRDHFRNLKAGRHSSRMLQFSFNKHHKHGTWIKQIEKIDPNLGKGYLLSREEYWINVSRSFDFQHGFNFIRYPTIKTAFSSKNGKILVKKRSREYVLHDSFGQRFVFSNLTQFCRERELPYKQIAPLFSGSMVQFNGWRADPNRIYKNYKTYFLKSESGEMHKIVNLEEFCRQNNLCSYKMRALVHGRTKKAYGWTLNNQT